MLRSICCLPAVAAALMLFSPTCAGDAPVGKQRHGCFVRCPNCHNTCTLSVEKGTVKRECYEVECKQICIPRVTFPWQKKTCCSACGGKGCRDGKSGCCAAHTCAKAKSVRVLKKYEYECPACKFHWIPDGEKDGYKAGVMKDKMIVPGAAPADDVDVPPPPPISAEHRPQLPPVRVVTR